MERVYKSLMGFNPEKEGKPATHVILSIEEYNNLLNNIKNAKNESEQIIKQTKSELISYKLEINNKVKQEKSKFKKYIERMQSEFSKAENEIVRLNDLNVNMLRIAKERANAKRGLKPKKVHNGYLVLYSQQCSYLHRTKGKTIQFPSWKVRIQSPHDSSIPFETIVKTIEDDLNNILDIMPIYKDLDISKFNINEIQELWDEKGNFIYKAIYKANMKSNLWEAEYFVKSSIIVPEDMRSI